jgi:hypothetical protein
MQKRALFILFAYCSLMVQASAQEDSADAADAEPIIIEAEEPTDSSDDGESSGAAEARAEDDDERFIPSREIPPDEQVIFPIDI